MIRWESPGTRRRASRTLRDPKGRIVNERADKLIVLADSSKFISRGSLVVCPLSRIDILITDNAAPAAALDMLREAGVQVQLIDVEVSGLSHSKAVA